MRIIDVHSRAPEQNAALHANACVAAPTLPVYPLPRSMISDYNTPDEAKYGVRNLFYVSEEGAGAVRHIRHEPDVWWLPNHCACSHVGSRHRLPLPLAAYH